MQSAKKGSRKQTKRNSKLTKILATIDKIPMMETDFSHIQLYISTTFYGNKRLQTEI